MSKMKKKTSDINCSAGGKTIKCLESMLSNYDDNHLCSATFMQILHRRTIWQKLCQGSMHIYCD